MFYINRYENIIKTYQSIFHLDILNILKIISNDNSIPHIVFYGPLGSGKRLLIKKFLEMLYDSDINKETDTIYTINGSGNTEKSVIIKQSNYHIVIEPQDNNFDKFLVQHIVKEYAKKIPLNAFKTQKSFKVVLINNMDKLSYYAQTSLRRTMEKYSYICRFIMWTNSLSKIIEPIRSRCMCIRVNSPSYDELFNLLFMINFKDKLNMSLYDYTYIINNCDRNIKKTLWLLELQKYGLVYNNSLKSVINLILEDIKNNNIDNIRELLYKLIVANINCSDIVVLLTKGLCKLNLSIYDLYKIIEAASLYEYNIVRGRRDIIHMEAFVFAVINILSKIKI